MQAIDVSSEILTFYVKEMERLDITYELLMKKDNEIWKSTGGEAFAPIPNFERYRKMLQGWGESCEWSCYLECGIFRLYIYCLDADEAQKVKDRHWKFVHNTKHIDTDGWGLYERSNLN